jgi:hypothetical protein
MFMSGAEIACVVPYQTSVAKAGQRYVNQEFFVISSCIIISIMENL